MKLKRLFLSTVAAVAVFGVLGASSAQANTYCALSPGDPNTGACDTVHTNTATAVVDAVTDARNNSGPDNVLIGPGVFTSPTSIDLNGSNTGNTVTITGQGPATILSVSNSEAPSITFDSGAGSSLNDVTIEIPASSSSTPKEGLVVRNSFDGEPPVVRNLNLYVAGGGESKNLSGVVLYSGSDLDNSVVDVASANYYSAAVKADGQGSEISRTYMAANTGAIQNSNNGDLTLNRSEIDATGFGIKNGSGLLYVNDSSIELSSGNAQVAIENKGGNAVSGDAYFNGSTIIANAGAGIRVESSEGSADANFFLDNSVLAGAAGTIEVKAAGAGDTAYFGSDSGAYDSTKLSMSGSGTIYVDPVDVVDLSTVSPGFVNAGAGNYRLAAGSALIDAGQDVDPPLGALDYEGNPRACHGTDDGVIRRDIGAFEFKTDPNDDCTYPEASISGPTGPAGTSAPSFDLGSSKANSTFVCSIDGSPYQSCPDPFTTPTLPAGDHTIDVKARDSFGNLQQTGTHLDFTIEPATCDTDPDICPPPTCETDPSLCPVVDKTAPKVLGLKYPRKTKASKAKVRFRSNEAGVTFTCRLNKAKAKKCKSPWKTPKLKKGKNTIQVQATDKAGNRSKVAKLVIKRVVKRK